MSPQPSLFDAPAVARPCWARWRGTCNEAATCQVRTGVAGFWDSCDGCAEGRRGWAENLDLFYERVELDAVPAVDPEHRYVVTLPSGFARSFSEWFRADQYARRFDGTLAAGGVL